MVKIAALSVNGTGPYTDWKSVETYFNDLYGECFQLLCLNSPYKLMDMVVGLIEIKKILVHFCDISC